VADACVEKDTLGSSRFAGINVRGNTNIPSVLKIFLCHDYSSKGILD
jgi:hypothetical protein